MYVLDKDSNKRILDAVNLLTTEELPKDTSINYYISIDKDTDNTLTHQNFIPVTPGEKLIFDNLKTGEIKSATVDVGSIKTGKARLRLSLHKYALPETLVVWRNVGVPTTNTLTYHGEESGWRKDGLYYKCLFRIDDPDGMIFNFGENGAVIDNRYVVGITHLEAGEHKFKTHEKNWVPVAAESTDKADTLYPYNHKLLIEGHPNIPLYEGVDFYAAYKMVRVGEFDFENNIKATDYEKYYFDNETNSLYFKLHVDEDYECTQTIPNYKVTRELFDVEYRYKRSSSAYANIDQMLLKAVLKTINDNVTPQLLDYKLQLTYR